MKKFLLPFLLVLIAALCLSPAASADQVELGTVSQGQSVYMYVDLLPAGSTMTISAYPPADLRVTQLSQPGGIGVYIEGTASTPGLNSFSLFDPSTGNTRTYTLNVSASASSSAPAVSGGSGGINVAVSEDVYCYAGEYALLSAAAQSYDGGTLSYQWYCSTDISGYGAQPLPGATGPEYSPGTSKVGSFYYFCTVTSTGPSGQSHVNSPMITVTVMEAPSVVSIRLNSTPSRLTYRVGESLDLTGISLVAYLSNGDELLLTNGFSYSPTKLEQAGQVNVTVNYEGWVCSFPVTVTEESITGIAVLSMPERSTYAQGDSLDTTGLVIRAYTASGNYQDVSGGFTVSPTRLSQSGTQTITVSYKGQSATFSVTVRELVSTLEVSSTPVKLSYEKGERLDTRGLVLRLTSGGTPQIINSGFSCEPEILSTVGTQTVTVRYGQLSTSFTVSVSEPRQSPSPTPSAAPAPSASAAPEDGDAPASPSPTPRVIAAQRRGPNKTFLLVVMFLALLTLVGLGAWLYRLNRPSRGDSRPSYDEDRGYSSIRDHRAERYGKGRADDADRDYYSGSSQRRDRRR